jgi:hypothetical protein
VSLSCRDHFYRGRGVLDCENRGYDRLDSSFAPHAEYRIEDRLESVRIVLRVGAPIDAGDARIAQKQPAGGYRRDRAAREANHDKSAVPSEATHALLCY